MENVRLESKKVYWWKVKLRDLADVIRDLKYQKGFSLISVSIYGLFNNKVLIVYETSFMED